MKAQNKEAATGRTVLTRVVWMAAIIVLLAASIALNPKTAKANDFGSSSLFSDPFESSFSYDLFDDPITSSPEINPLGFDTLDTNDTYDLDPIDQLNVRLDEPDPAPLELNNTPPEPIEIAQSNLDPAGGGTNTDVGPVSPGNPNNRAVGCALVAACATGIIDTTPDVLNNPLPPKTPTAPFIQGNPQGVSGGTPPGGTPGGVPYTIPNPPPGVPGTGAIPGPILPPPQFDILEEDGIEESPFELDLGLEDDEGIDD